MEQLAILWNSTALAHFEPGQVIMMAVGALLLYLAIVRALPGHYVCFT